MAFRVQFRLRQTFDALRRDLVQAWLGFEQVFS